MVGKNAAQAGVGHEKAHHVMTEERLHVQVACTDSKSIALASIRGHRLEGSGACGSRDGRGVR